MNLGEEIPHGIMELNGTPTVYFLDTNNEILVEPMIGEKMKDGILHS